MATQLLRLWCLVATFLTTKLGTAILALIAFAVLQGKTQKLSDDINEASVSVLNLIVTNRDKLDLSTLGTAREE